MRRILLVLAVTAILVLVLAVPAFADANPNEHNFDNACAGGYWSEVAPNNLAFGAMGEFSRDQGTKGIRGDEVKSGMDVVANCGDNPDGDNT